MTHVEKKAVADAISTLLLADHMGDAHEATETLVKLLWGKRGVKELEQYHEDGGRAICARLREFLPDIWWADDEDDEEQGDEE